MKKLKNSILALCAVTALASGAYAQSTGITPPASTNTSTASPTTGLQSQDPAKTDIVNPIEDARTHDSVLNGVNKDDVSNSPDPLDSTLDPLDGRNKLEPTAPSQVTPISPSSPEQPVRTAPLLESPSSIKDSTTTSPMRNDVSNVEQRSSSMEYKATGIYDTDGDGQLDTNEMLKGPVQPVTPAPGSTTQPTP